MARPNSESAPEQQAPPLQPEEHLWLHGPGLRTARQVTAAGGGYPNLNLDSDVGRWPAAASEPDAVDWADALGDARAARRASPALPLYRR